MASALVLLLAGCSGQEEPPAPTVTMGPVACTVALSSPEAVSEALADAVPGTTVCVTGDALAGTDLVVERSGEEGRPVVLAAEGAPVRSVTVRADFVTVQGLTVEGGTGIDLFGHGLVAQDNEVVQADQDGISCEGGCTDLLVEGNTVVGTDGTGIIVEGERITVRGNDVSASVRRQAGDADGIRFFGTDVQIVGNTVHDIKDDGYTGEPPHTDCFQTYDNSRLPTVDALVADNVCRNVDHQCLIATAEEAGESGDLGRSRGLRFENNTCEVEGSQAVLVRWFPEVEVVGNGFDGPFLDRAAIFLDGSTGAEFTGNDVPDGVPPVEVDEASERGFTTDTG
ncbi:right-handed parallel beta-helix repeat-containing protein [Blastococcus sp. SYSU D00820]